MKGMTTNEKKNEKQIEGQESLSKNCKQIKDGKHLQSERRTSLVNLCYIEIVTVYLEDQKQVSFMLTVLSLYKQFNERVEQVKEFMNNYEEPYDYYTIKESYFFSDRQTIQILPVSERNFKKEVKNEIQNNVQQQ